MAVYEPAVELVLKREMGFQRDPHDPGNWTGKEVGQGELKGTNMGISGHSYPNEDIEHLTMERAKELYFRDYWSHGFEQFTDQAIANYVMCMAVNMQKTGKIGPAILILQRAITACGHTVMEDEILGPLTINAANGIPGQQLLSSLRSECLSHYRALVRAQPLLLPYLKGWEQRALS